MSTSASQGALNVRALIAVYTGAFLASLDTAIANTALPVIATDLHAAPAASIWVINAYQLAVVATLLPFAALGDRLGPRRVFLAGAITFIVGSLACALCSSLLGLAAARALQGLGAGGLMSVNLALVRMIFPPEKLGRGVGMNALVVGIGFTMGPSAASLILSLTTWPWLFAINVPIGVVALGLAWGALPRTERHGHGFDPITALLTATTFAALIFALSSAAQREPWQVVAPALAVTVVMLVLLLRRQAGHPAPMLPVDLLKLPMFALSTCTALASFSTQGLGFVSLPFFFHYVLHRNPVDTGLLITAWPAVVALAAPFAGRLSDRYPPGLLGGIGLAILSVGMALLATLPLEASAANIVWRMAVCGLGFGLFQSPNLRAFMSSAPGHRASGASGMVALARLIGQTSGAALVALCFGLAGSQHGPVVALWLGCAFAAIGAVASSARLWAARPGNAAQA